MNHLNKYLRIFIFSLTVVLVPLACSDREMDLDSPNGPSSGTFPASYQEAKMGLYAAYRSLSTLDAASTPILHVMDNITDIGYARPGNNYTSPITSAITTTNSLTNKPWRVHYETIARVHAVLDKLPELKEKISSEQFDELDSELRFIRAYIYSQLIELYGDVPLLKAAVTIEDSNQPRTPIAEVQQFIIDEMAALAEKLPSSQSQYGNVRASKVAAYMLQARVALYAKKYPEAIAAAQKALNAANGLHSLTPFNSTVAFAGKDHSVGEPDVANVFGHAGYASSKEWIWVAEYNMAVSGYLHNQQYYMASRLAKGVSYWGPTQNLIDSFQSIDGLPITESPLYDENNPFQNRDPRLDMYTARPHARYLGIQFEPNPSFSKVKNYWPVTTGGASEPSEVTNTDATNAYRSFSGYLWRKGVDLNDYQTTSVSGKSDLDVGIFRYAELLLIYAEAKIESGQLDESVYQAIDQIRERAKMPKLPRGLSQEKLRTALRYERKIELANDGLRWYDLRRWGIADEVMNGYLYLNRNAKPWTKSVLTGFDESFSPIYNHSEATKYFTTQEVIYQQGKDEYWPIPQAEMDANPNMTQNPGY